MSTIALNARSARLTSFRAALVEMVAHLFELREGARDGLQLQTRCANYARMSQPELAQLGISRSDTYRAALRGRPV